MFQSLLRLLLLCFAIAQLQVSAAKSKVFEPIPYEFPDIVRTGKEAAKYREQLLDSLKPRARKGDFNQKFTGESCARGLGDVYKV